MAAATFPAHGTEDWDDDLLAYLNDREVAAARRYPNRLRALLRQVVAPTLSPETVTVGAPVNMGAAAITATTGSGLSSPVMHTLYNGGVFANGLNTARFKVFGWSLAARYTNYGLAANPAGLTGGSYPTSLDFVHYGAGFDLRFVAESANPIFQIDVDGLPVSATALTATVSAGASTLLPITFSGGVKLRRIRLHVTRTMAMGGVVIAGTGLLTAGGASGGPQAVLFGDSYGDGANGVTALDTYAAKLSRYLNLDLWIDAQGGTGLVATGGTGSKAAFQARIVSAGTDARLNPDIVFMQGSTNDANGNEGGVPAAAALALTTIKAQWPNAKVIVTGLMYPRGTLYTGMATANTALRTASAGVADLFIDAQTEGWYTGNSVNTSPVGGVNSDVFMSSDGTHPTPADHEFKASLLARRTVNLVSAA